MVNNELEVVRNFTWAVLGMEDAIFDIWEVSLDGTPNFFNIHELFSPSFVLLHSLFLCFFWISLWLRIGVYNTLASKFCVKLLKPPKIQIPMPNTSFRIC